MATVILTLNKITHKVVFVLQPIHSRTLHSTEQSSCHVIVIAYNPEGNTFVTLWHVIEIFSQEKQNINTIYWFVFVDFKKVPQLSKLKSLVFGKNKTHGFWY